MRSAVGALLRIQYLREEDDIHIEKELLIHYSNFTRSIWLVLHGVLYGTYCHWCNVGQARSCFASLIVLRCVFLECSCANAMVLLAMPWSPLSLHYCCCLPLPKIITISPYLYNNVIMLVVLKQWLHCSAPFLILTLPESEYCP
eukprot:scpid39787/ scgid27346/ 